VGGGLLVRVGDWMLLDVLSLVELSLLEMSVDSGVRQLSQLFRHLITAREPGPFVKNLLFLSFRTRKLIILMIKSTT